MKRRHSRSPNDYGELSSRHSSRTLAERAFSRAAGAPLVDGNSVRLLIDATQNYPAWLSAIESARHHVHFESYIIQEDSAGLKFADALIARAQAGVRVRVIYDWLGGLGKTSRQFWNRFGARELRCDATTLHILILHWDGFHVIIVKCSPWMERLASSRGCVSDACGSENQRRISSPGEILV